MISQAANVALVRGSYGQKAEAMAKILRAYILFWGVLAIQSCGQKESSSDLKISGGVQSYYLDRVAEFTVGVNQTCTGVMLSDNHVLTAAHCVS